MSIIITLFKWIYDDILARFFSRKRTLVVKVDSAGIMILNNWLSMDNAFRSASIGNIVCKPFSIVQFLDHSDGAAALVLVSGEKAVQLGLQVIAKISGYGDAAQVYNDILHQ